MIYGLTKNSVTIMTGEDNHAKAYQNSVCGRTALAAEQPPEMVTEVMEVWGDTPTVPDPEPPQLQPDTTPPPPTLEERIAALEAVQLEQILGGAV